MKRAKAGTDYNITVLPVIASLKNKKLFNASATRDEILPQNASEPVWRPGSVRTRRQSLQHFPKPPSWISGVGPPRKIRGNWEGRKRRGKGRGERKRGRDGGKGKREGSRAPLKTDSGCATVRHHSHIATGLLGAAPTLVFLLPPHPRTKLTNAMFSSYYFTICIVT